MGTIYGYPHYMNLKRQQPQETEQVASKPQLVVEGLPAEILAAFMLEPTGSSKKGEVWSLTTARGEVQLKVDHGNPTELQERLAWQQYLRDKGALSVPALLKNDQGELVSKNGNDYYYGWLQPQGEAFCGQKVKHLYDLINSLAAIHLLSSSYEQDHKSPQNFDWPIQVQDRLTDLLVYSGQMAEHRLTDDFQRIFMENFDFLYDQGQEAIQKMVLTHCTSSCPSQLINLVDNFLPENLLLSEEKVIFCNLSSRRRGPRVLDLASFLRSYLGQQSWDLDLTKGLIQRYHEVAPLNSTEKNLLLSMMRFPTRFWFYARQYQLREKSTPELAHKLINLIYEVRLRDRCLDSLDSLLSEGE